MRYLLATLVTMSLLVGFAAHAGQYQEITTEYEPRILVTGPDTFHNRMRYWFIMPDGKPSIYYVVEKIGRDKWRVVDATSANSAKLTITNGIATLDSDMGKVRTFKKIK